MACLPAILHGNQRRNTMTRKCDLCIIPSKECPALQANIVIPNIHPALAKAYCSEEKLRELLCDAAQKRNGKIQ